MLGVVSDIALLEHKIIEAMACEVQSYNHQLETEIELSNDYAAISPSVNWPISCGGLQLDCLPTEDECTSAPVYYQEQLESHNTKQASLVPDQYDVTIIAVNSIIYVYIDVDYTVYSDNRYVILVWGRDYKQATFQFPGKGWWDSDIAPSVYQTLKEREKCLAKIEYRSPQLMSR